MSEMGRQGRNVPHPRDGFRGVDKDHCLYVRVAL